MISLPVSQCHQKPTRSRTAFISSLIKQWDVQAVFQGAPVSPLGRLQAARGGLSRLLSDLRGEDPALYEHGVHVWALTRRLAAYLKYPEKEQATITLAALVHDVGKLTLPRATLDKPTSLTPQEYALIQQHCAAGARLLQQMQFDDRVIELVYHHHERWDGQGYPQGLAGLAIPQQFIGSGKDLFLGAHPHLLCPSEMKV